MKPTALTCDGRRSYWFSVTSPDGFVREEILCRECARQLRSVGYTVEPIAR